MNIRFMDPDRSARLIAANWHLAQLTPEEREKVRLARRRRMQNEARRVRRAKARTERPEADPARQLCENRQEWAFLQRVRADFLRVMHDHDVARQAAARVLASVRFANGLRVWDMYAVKDRSWQLVAFRYLVMRELLAFGMGPHRIGRIFLIDHTSVYHAKAQPQDRLLRMALTPLSGGDKKKAAPKGGLVVNREETSNALELAA